MAVGELARVLHAVNFILEKSSSSVGLSKRAALALAMLSDEESMSNQDLQDRFLKHTISTPKSVKKDASTAKSDLLDNEYIKIRNKVSVYEITDKGRQVVVQMYGAMGAAIDQLGLSAEHRAMLRQLVSVSTLPARHQPKKESATSRQNAAKWGSQEIPLTASPKSR